MSPSMKNDGIPATISPMAGARTYLGHTRLSGVVFFKTLRVLSDKFPQVSDLKSIGNTDSNVQRHLSNIFTVGTRFV